MKKRSKAFNIFLLFGGLMIVLLSSKVHALAGEKIFYNVNPVGKVEYIDEGEKSIFHIRIWGFDYQDIFYKDSTTQHVQKIERKQRWWLGHWDAIDNFETAKSVDIKPKELAGVIRPEVLYLFKANFPTLLTFKLKDKETLSMHDLTYDTYHFVSEPYMFDIWIDAGPAHIPVMVKGSGNYRGHAMKLRLYEKP